MLRVPRNVWGAAMGAFAGKVYLMGGDSDFFAGGTSNEVNIYDIATDTWRLGTADAHRGGHRRVTPRPVSTSTSSAAGATARPAPTSTPRSGST